MEADGVAKGFGKRQRELMPAGGALLPGRSRLMDIIAYGPIL